MKPSPRLICVAVAVAVATLLANASAAADSGGPSTPPRAGPSASGVKLMKGPYLQSLGTTSVEIRAEVDPPAPASVEITGVDGGKPRVVRDDVSGAMHALRLSGLTASTHYRYSFEAGATVAKGEFTTAPSAESRAPFTVLVYGDNRTDDVAHASIIRAMLASPSDFVINTGDLVEDGASSSNWQSFFDIEAPLIRSRSVFACVGNHEITDGAGALYLHYFAPTSDAHGEDEKPKLYGSFRWADARFFLLDAMESFDSGPERAWLEDELTRADGEPGLSWRVVVLHHGPWSAGPHGGNARAMRAGIPALFSSHHVDLILAGHDHIYERGFASGMGYVVSGGGGAPLYEISNVLPSTRKAESVHHFIELVVASDAIHLVAKRDDGTVIERCGMTSTAAGRGWDCDPAPAPSMQSNPPRAPPTPAATKCACDAVGARTEGSLRSFADLAALAMVAGTALVARRRPNRG